MKPTPFENPEVMFLFDNYPTNIQPKLMDLRELIFAVASDIEGVGQLEETLKWGQPSYLTPETRSGSTIRIDKIKQKPHHYAMYLNCQTTLVETFRELYPSLEYEGNRAIIFDSTKPLPIEAIKDCIAMALAYHLRKKQH